MSLMPPIKLFASKCCTFLTASISLNGEIISPYSYCVKKGLVCVTITDPFGRQLSSCTKYTKLNTYMLYNMRLVSLNKYTLLYYMRH